MQWGVGEWGVVTEVWVVGVTGGLSLHPFFLRLTSS